MHEPVAQGTTGRAETIWSRLGNLAQRFFSLAAAGQRKRLLRVRETLSLGDKRFLAVVEYDRRKFLIAGTAQNISLLERLNEPGEIENAMPAQEPGAGMDSEWMASAATKEIHE